MALSLARSDASSNSNTFDSSVNSQAVTLYATYNINSKIYLDGFLAGGISQVNNSRVLIDNSVASAEYDGIQFSTRSTLGYKHNVGDWNIIPFIAAEYFYVSYDDYTEEGSSAPLAVSASDFNSLESGLGVRLERFFKRDSVTPTTLKV